MHITLQILAGRSNVVQLITWEPLLTTISNTNNLVRYMYMYLYLTYKETFDTQILADH